MIFLLSGFDVLEGLVYNGFVIRISRGRAVEARQAHNLKVVGSNPTPATNSTFIFYNVYREEFSIFHLYLSHTLPPINQESRSRSNELEHLFLFGLS